MTAKMVTTLSEHPLATQAVGECAGALLEAGGPGPDLVLIGVTAPHAGALEDILHATSVLLSPTVQLGASSERLVSGSREVDGSAAVAICAMWSSQEHSSGLLHGASPRIKAPIRPVRLELHQTGPNRALHGIEQLRDATGTLVLLADAAMGELDLCLDRIAEIAPLLVVVGGTPGTSRNSGATRLCLDKTVYTHGLVAALLPSEIATSPQVSQGCMPLGQPMLATRVERNVIYELGGQPALEVVQSVLSALPPEARSAARDSLHLGLLPDPVRGVTQQQFLYCNVLGADKAALSILVGRDVPVGSPVQFALRDSATAAEDLLRVLSEVPVASGCLAFTARGRGADHFGNPLHDASRIAEALEPAAVWGIACFDSFGPIGAMSELHEQAATLLVFT